MELNTETVTVTPDLATEWLEKNTRNRRLQRPKVVSFARQMRSGLWKLNHQGIGFYDTNELADGQHRLEAVVLANTPVKMRVSWGVTVEAGAHIDRHRPRGEADSIRIGGLSDWIRTTEVSVITTIAQVHGGFPNKLTSEEIVEIGDAAKESIQFAIGSMPGRKKYLTTSPIMAAVAIAHPHVDPDRLEQFSAVLVSGMPDSADDVAVIRLREWLISNEGPATGSSGRRDAVWRTQRAIKAFCDYEQIGKLYTPKGMIYRLDDVDRLAPVEVFSK